MGVHMSRNPQRRRYALEKLFPVLKYGSQYACEPLETRTLLSVAILNGAGSGYAGNGGGNPPDVTGAAGPNSYLEVTNDTATLFDKATGTILRQRGMQDFF